jgi:hypothetical protein
MSLPLQSPPITRRRTGVSPSDACVGATVNGRGEVCVNTPFGSLCIPISTPLPPGTSVQACVSVCTHAWVPTGACATVSFSGITIGRSCVGWC